MIPSLIILLRVKKRLETLDKRLKCDEIFENYNEIFKEYEVENIIERVPEEEISKGLGLVHYLPHRPVIRADKETTKIRAVFDASCANNGPSLNECLYSGPNLLSKVFDVLLRFRLHKIGILADIKQAFLNIEISESDRDFLRFLWHDTSDLNNSKVIAYRFLRVVFGVTCSPFLLHGTIKHHLEKFLLTDRVLVSKLLDDFYVDDLTSGVDDISNGKTFCSRTFEIMSRAGLELRKWISNSKELNCFLEKEMSVSYPEGNCKQVLGLEWNINEDCFVFDFIKFLRKCEGLKITKRSILSLAASFYDPLGFISPVTSRIKVIFQKICKNKLGWDDEVSGELKTSWFRFVSILSNLRSVKLQRFVLDCDFPPSRVELHGFCDSSIEVYCAVVYIRIVSESGAAVQFLCAKTKVSPLKSLTIPRLELLGCLLLSDLLKECFYSLRGRVALDDTYCWTDSKIALCWIRGKEKCWKPWVENRVVRIRSVVDRKNWYHVKGELNPADFPTRDFDLLSEMWTKGPSFLLNNNFFESLGTDFVDSSFVDENNSDVNQEKRKNDSCVFASFSSFEKNHDKISLYKVFDLSRYSSLNTAINILAYVYRFIYNSRSRAKEKTKQCKKVIEEEITLDEFNNALKKVIKSEQSNMKEEKDFAKLKDSLKLFEDEDGLWRLRGRFANSSLKYEQQFPIILNGESQFTRLVIINAHEVVLHNGVESTLANVRQRYWITSGRRTVKRILRRCNTCRRFQGRVMKAPPTPDLPNYRTQLLNAFQATGCNECFAR